MVTLRNIEVISPEDLKFYDKEEIEYLKDKLHQEMCEKLACLGINLMENQAITRDIFARSQQSDDYLSVIYQSLQEGTNDFPSFFIKNTVL